MVEHIEITDLKIIIDKLERYKKYTGVKECIKILQNVLEYKKLENDTGGVITRLSNDKGTVLKGIPVYILTQQTDNYLDYFEEYKEKIINLTDKAELITEYDKLKDRQINLLNIYGEYLNIQPVNMELNKDTLYIDKPTDPQKESIILSRCKQLNYEIINNVAGMITVTFKRTDADQ